jgi:undecaprenyl phosphate-alpha-L-ara4N flippase subunit ArnE
MKTKLWAIATMFFITFMTSIAQILWKLGADKLYLDLFAIITNWQVIAGVALYAIAGTLMIISFRGGEVSVLYPIVATSYIWVSFLAVFFLGETMGLFKWVGVFTIFSGIVLIGYGSRKSEVMEKAGIV